jgi:hypothetical protein
VAELDVQLMIDDYQSATQNDDPWSPGTDPEAVKVPKGVKPPMPTAGASTLCTRFYLLVRFMLCMSLDSANFLD